MHQAGAAGLTQLLTEEPPAQRDLPCPCGGTADYEELRSKQVLTAVGPARMLRPYYLCSRCHQGQFPTDQALDVEKTEFSPGVRRMLGVVGSECSSFRLGAEQMLLLAGLEVTAKAVERVAEAIGADIVAREQAEIQKAMQLELPAAAGPSISPLYTQDYRRGWSRAIHRVVLADGQHYNWSIAQEHFPDATQIVDLCHARQHVWELGANLYPSDKAAKVSWIKVHQNWLDDGQIEN